MYTLKQHSNTQPVNLNKKHVLNSSLNNSTKIKPKLFNKGKKHFNFYKRFSDTCTEHEFWIGKIFLHDLRAYAIQKNIKIHFNSFSFHNKNNHQIIRFFL